MLSIVQHNTRRSKARAAWQGTPDDEWGHQSHMFERWPREIKDSLVSLCVSPLQCDNSILASAHPPCHDA